MGEELGVAVGAGIYRDAFPVGRRERGASYAIAPQWRPTENFELRPFFSRIVFSEEESEQLMLTAGGVLPPKIRRDHYYGQEWATNEGEILNYGVIGATRFGAWTARLGLFESVFAADAQFAELFTDIDAQPQRERARRGVSGVAFRFEVGRAAPVARVRSRPAPAHAAIRSARPVAEAPLRRRRRDRRRAGAARRRPRRSRGRSSTSASSRTTK